MIMPTLNVVDGLYWVQKSDLPKWKKQMTFKDNFKAEVNMVTERDGWQCVGLPRTWAAEDDQSAKHDIDNMRDGFGISCILPPAPRNQKQLALMDQIFKHSYNGGTGGIIVAPTGFGKTWVGAQLINRYRVSTLVVTTKKDEMENWCKEAERFLSIKPERWHGDVIPDASAQIVVGLVQSIAKGTQRYDFDIFERFGLVIFDECHRMGAEFFSQAAGYLPARLRYGMTATPDRVDGRERVFKAHIGEIIAEATGVPMVPKIYLVPSEFKLPVKVTNGKVRPVEPTVGRSSWVDRALRRNAHRNKQLVRIIEYAHKHDRYTVVFSNERKHLEELHAACNIPDDEKGFYVGGMKQDALDTSAVKSTIFSTYQMGGQGTNYPWWDCCILATPMANIKQPIGRILREFPEKKQPVVFDICDPGYVWGGYKGKRCTIYDEYGAVYDTISV